MTAISSRDKQAQENWWYHSKKGIPFLQTPTSCKHGRYILNTTWHTVTCISVRWIHGLSIYTSICEE